MDKWSKDEMKQLKDFWEGEIGKKYIKRMEDTKEQLLRAAMGSSTPEDAFRYSAIANGFDSVLQDIEAVVKGVDKKKEAAAKNE